MHLPTGTVTLKKFGGKYSPDHILTKKGGGKGWEPDSAKFHVSNRSTNVNDKLKMPAGGATLVTR